MNISKQSWHYRFIRSVYSRLSLKWFAPVTLCTYFSTVVFTLVLVGLIIPMTIVGMGVDLYAWIAVTAPEGQSAIPTFLESVRQVIPSPLFEIVYLSCFIGTIAWMLIGVGSIVVLFTLLVFVVHKLVFKIAYASVRNDSIIQSWIKAKKENVCPIINYTD